MTSPVYEGLAARRDLLLGEIEDMTAIIAKEGLVVTGSAGQPITHPLVSARHTALSQLRMVEGQLRRQADEEQQQLRNVPVHLRGRP